MKILFIIQVTWFAYFYVCLFIGEEVIFKKERNFDIMFYLLEDVCVH